MIALDNAGNPSELSNIVRIEPDISPPAPATNFMVLTDPNKQINLSWTGSQSADVSHYNIYRNSNSDIFAQTNKTFYIDENVAAGMEYSYIVKSVDFSGNEDNNTSGAAAVAKDEIVLLDVNYPKKDSDLNQDRIAVIGRTDKDAGIALRNTIKGTEFSYDAVVDKNGLFIGYAMLGNGENNIEIYAKDSAGNENNLSIAVKNRFALFSNTSIEQSVTDIKNIISDNTVNKEIISELAKNDPNIANNKENVENYITGASVPFTFSPLYIILN